MFIVCLHFGNIDHIILCLIRVAVKELYSILVLLEPPVMKIPICAHISKFWIN